MLIPFRAPEKIVEISINRRVGNRDIPRAGPRRTLPTYLETRADGGE